MSLKCNQKLGSLNLQISCNTSQPPVQIALVTETFLPEINGVASTLSRLVVGLGNRGHKVTIIRPKQRGEPMSGPRIFNAAEGFEQCLVHGWPIPFYNSLRAGSPAGGLLRKRWTENRPDVVHVATEGPLGYSALKTARAMGIPATSSFHTNFHQYGGHYGMGFGRGWIIRYLRWFHNQAACTLVPTTSMETELAKMNFERLAVLSRGVDARLFNPIRRNEELRKAWGVTSEHPVVIYVGRLAAEKNLNLAVEAYQAMRLINPRARFVLVGDGPLKSRLQERYPDFIYAGTRQGEELAAYYASADVFMFSSVTETFGNVVTEALASGLVVIGYDYAAMRQHVRDGVNGFAAKYCDRDAFLEIARAVIVRRADWPAVRAAARVTGQSISWEAVIGQFEAKLAGAAKSR